MTKDQLKVIENLRKEHIQNSVQILEAYCYRDNSRYTEVDAIEELEKIIREMNPGESLGQYPVLGDVIYYGILVRLPIYMLRMVINKSPNTQFAKDCEWCINKKKSIKEKIQKMNLKTFRIYWIDDGVEDVYGTSIADALFREGYDSSALDNAFHWEEVDDFDEIEYHDEGDGN